ncbi:MAG: sulfurtransferase [Acidiferrobacterales bacterium]|nr:sulfurtransferase [Acidiferrobacterales bacterium]
MAFTTVISAEELSAHIDSPDWVVVDCRFTLTDPGAGKRNYDENHIPGARYMHLDDDLAAPVTEKTGRHPLPDPDTLATKLGELGIGNNTQVVAYDDTFGAMASRLWWLLRWMGHDEVALLDGGLPAWVRKKLPLSTETPAIEKKTFVPSMRDDMVVDMPAVQAIVAKRKKIIIDARAEERFTGEVEPLDKVAGHIPGALNLPYEDNLDLDGTFMSREEIVDLYHDFLGDKSGNDVVMMCGSGVTACHNLVAMEIAGLKGAKLYAGSWSEWITNPDNPVETGE